MTKAKFGSGHVYYKNLAGEISKALEGQVKVSFDYNCYNLNCVLFFDGYCKIG